MKAVVAFAAALCLVAPSIGAAVDEAPLPTPRPRPPVERPAAAPADRLPAAPATAPVVQVGPAPAGAADAPASGAAHRTACPSLLEGRVKGRYTEPIAEGDCGAQAPLAIAALGETRLATEAIMTCAMAESLANLAAEAQAIARETMGAALVGFDAGSGYECRRRNRADTGKLSEHAFANAFDILGFRFANGKAAVVERDWPHLPQLPADGEPRPAPLGRAQTPEARFLARIHAAACKRFTTVLGPDADASHRNHFHFDLGCHGRDCTYTICQ